MSELIKEIQEATADYYKALNQLTAVIKKHADAVQEKTDKQEGAIRDEIHAEFVEMFYSLPLLSDGPKFVLDRDRKVWEAAQKKAFKYLLGLVSKPITNNEIKVALRFLVKKGLR